MAGAIDLGIDHLDEIEVIGRGGFSTVYAATDVRFSRRVAVKVLAQLVDESDRRRFDRECQVMGRLSSHPNVVTVHDAGFTPDRRPYLIMELIEGGSLADLLSTHGPVPWTQAVDYVVPICDALERAHSEDILHRDIKPENILLGDDVPKVTDFGIAYLRDATGHSSTNITASWLHAPPETFENARDARSDLYSLASTLYNLVVGDAPFWQSGDESLSPLIIRVLNDPPPDIPAALAPAGLNQIVSRSLSKLPADRPQTMAELSATLRQFRADGGQQASYEQTLLANEHRAAYERDVVGNVDRRSGSSFEPQRLASQAATQPAGWYHAHGDAPNTIRYWNGNQWQGDPRYPSEAPDHSAPSPTPGAVPPPASNPLPGTAPPQSLAPTPGPSPTSGPSLGGYTPAVNPVVARQEMPPYAAAPASMPSGAPTAYAGLGKRLAAYLIDGGLVVLGYLILSALILAGDNVSIAFGDGVAVVGFFILFSFVAWNYVLKQGKTGQTIGKQTQKIRLVADAKGRPLGRGKALARSFIAILLATFTCGLGGILNLMWPLWDREQKRLTDKMLDLSVVDA